MTVKYVKQNLLNDLMKYSAQIIEEESNLQPTTQIYFVLHTIPVINDHLTYQDEELALNLINIIDTLKNLDEDAGPKSTLISDAAFSVDESISFNITSNLGSKKKKALQR